MQSSEVKEVQAALKKVLRNKGMTYRDLAASLGVAEITIKRFFAAQDLSFARLLDICTIIEIPLGDLIKATNSGRDKEFILSEEQEQALADHPDAYQFFILLRRFNDIAAAASKARLSAARTHQVLRKLESVGLIRLEPESKFTFNVQGAFTWRKDGPLQKTHMRRHLHNVIDHRVRNLDDQNALLASSEAQMSIGLIRRFQEDLRKLIQAYKHEAAREALLEDASKLIFTSWLFAFGPYEEDLREYFH